MYYNKKSCDVKEFTIENEKRSTANNKLIYSFEAKFLSTAENLKEPAVEQNPRICHLDLVSKSLPEDKWLKSFVKAEQTNTMND